VLDVEPAISVEVQPLTPSDWEVLEANAGFLEDQLLAQVPVLSPGQVFTVWARNAAVVRLKAIATQPPVRPPCVCPAYACRRACKRGAPLSAGVCSCLRCACLHLCPLS
jgi:hypothetical protein